MTGLYANQTCLYTETFKNTQAVPNTQTHIHTFQIQIYKQTLTHNLILLYEAECYMCSKCIKMTKCMHIKLGLYSCKYLVHIRPTTGITLVTNQVFVYNP